MIVAAYRGGRPRFALAARLRARRRPSRVAARAALPTRLTDQEFWHLIDDFSEPNGYFHSDNLVSNEDTFQIGHPDARADRQAGGAYLGVGPDQNFTYIVALEPRIAFIIDIRRGNLQVAPDVQGAHRVVGRSRGVPLAPVFAQAPAGLEPPRPAEELLRAFGKVDARSHALRPRTCRR